MSEIARQVARRRTFAIVSQALQNAASVAALLLTTDCMVAERVETLAEPAAHG